MTRFTTLSARGLATLALATSLVACSDAALPTDPAPELAKLNGTNGFELFQVAYPDDLLCANSPIVWTALSGHLKVAGVTPRQGGGVVVREIMSNGRITLSAGGKTLSSAMSGQAFYDIDANDNLVSITFLGSNGVFTAPGVGRIVVEVGKLVLGPGGDVLLERGQHDVFGSSPDVAKLCAYLGA